MLSLSDFIALLGAGALSTLCVAGCGPGTIGGAVRPDEPTLSKGLCDSVADQGQPLVVDWKAHERALVEATMRDGVAVVKYSCDGLEVLKDCKLKGDYGFLGVSRKEELVQLSDADEIRANLPAFGVELAGEIQRDSSLNVGMVMVGMKRTTVSAANKQQLEGSCGGATHFVRGAFTGAFVMTKGTRGHVATAATVFGKGASASSTSSKRSENRDGDVKACDAVKNGSSEPNPECDALLRLELTALGATPEKIVGTVDVCPAGLVLSEGKCTKPTEKAPFQCRDGQKDECEAQCNKDHAGSCAALGFMYFGNHGVKADAEKAVALSMKACTGGSARGCNNLGFSYDKATVLPRDEKKAEELFSRACEGGFPMGCTNLGVLLERTLQDYPRANDLYTRGCNGGEAAGCHYLAVNLEAGKGTPKDAQRANALYRRACAGKWGDSCTNLGVNLLRGDGIDKDVQAAVEQLKKGCNQGAGSACRNLAAAYHKGVGVSADPAKAISLYEKACEKKDRDSCGRLVTVHWMGVGVPKNMDRGAELAKKACDGGGAEGCKLLAVGHFLGLGLAKDPKQAAAPLTKACAAGDGQACAALGLMHRFGRGKAKSPLQAAGLFEQACNKRYDYGCHLLGMLYTQGEGVAADATRGETLRKKACSLGYGPGCSSPQTDGLGGKDIDKDVKLRAEVKKVYAAASVPPQKEDEITKLLEGALGKSTDKKTKPGSTDSFRGSARKHTRAGATADRPSRNDIKRPLVRARFGAMACYRQSARDNPDIKGGMMKLRIQIAPNGRARSVTATADPIGDEALLKCVQRRFKAARFPKLVKPLTVVYPIRFKPPPKPLSISTRCACSGSEYNVICALECQEIGRR